MRRVVAGALAVLALALTQGGCAAGAYCDAAESLQTKNPHASLEYVGLSLQADRGYDRAISLMQVKLLKSIAMEHEAKVAAMEAAGNFELAVADCDRVAASAYLASTLPGGLFQIYHENHRARLAEQAAEKFYQLGLSYQEQGDARQATNAFCRALGFRVNYKDARARYQESLSKAKVRLFVKVDEGCEDAAAVRVVADGLARSARARGLQFLEFVTDPSRASATCVVRAESAAYHDSGWQSQNGRDEVWVAKRDPKTGQVLTDAQGNALQEKKTGSWTTWSRETSYEVQFTFQVQAAAGDPAPTGGAARSAGDRGDYARWQGDAEAVPDLVRSLPSSPVQLKERAVLATHCASGAVEELAHQLFLAYEK